MDQEEEGAEHSTLGDSRDDAGWFGYNSVDDNLHGSLCEEALQPGECAVVNTIVREFM